MLLPRSAFIQKRDSLVQFPYRTGSYPDLNQS